VNQSNTAIAGSLAANGNKTTQSSTQAQGGAPGSSYGQQTSGQAAASKQDASSDATASQHGAKNSNISVRIFSEGDDGDVSQSNTVAGISAALNGNKTDQNASQNQGGGPTGSGTQAVLQGALSKQDARSSADASQHGVSNDNISVRIFSPGNNGAVNQSNTVLAGSLAANGNLTTQGAGQTQGGGYGGRNQQVLGQAAANDQYADSYADADQRGASNTNVPVRIFSEGNDGDVSQSNTVVGLSAALNGNKTDQTGSQSQGGSAPAPMPLLDPYSAPDKYPAPPKDAGSGTQAVGQIALNKQDADSTASASQEHVSNLSAPVRIGSKGDSGSTEQSNTVIAASLALNLNKTDQSVTQTQSGAGTLVQGSGQLAGSKQDATSCADAEQKDATNINAPVDVFSHGAAGSVSQANTAVALSAALNGNKTDQTNSQSQSGAPGSTLVQGSGQGAGSKQDADSNASTNQHGVSNENGPVLVDRPDLPKPCEHKQPCESEPKVGPPGYPCDARDDGACGRPTEPPKKCDSCQPKPDPCKHKVERRQPKTPCTSCERPKCPSAPRKERQIK
jgi:hypothetical protein